jgi:periplasmic protein TonB
MSQDNQSKPRVDRISHWLIRQAANHAPETLSERLQEEWLADLEGRASALSRLRFAAGCCWATRVISYEHKPAMVAISTSAIAPKLMLSALQFNFGRFSSRSATFFLVVSLHMAVFYLVFTALSHTYTKISHPEIQNVPLDRRLPVDPPLPIPKPRVTGVALDEPKEPYVLFPAEPLDPIDPAATKGSDQDLAPQPAVDALPPHAAKHVAGGPGAGFPNPDDYYPSRSRVLGEEGVATAQVCVNANGQLSKDPTVLASAGSQRLDDAALKLARAGSGHYRASSEDGRAVDSCFAFRIRFYLKK